MPTTTRVLLHSNGPALWPEHRPLAEVKELEATTPEPIWWCTYQGRPTPPSGQVFRREWWFADGRRFDAGDPWHVNACVARWLSWDTAFKDTATSAFTACSVGELWPDYRLALREVWRRKLQFPDLPEMIAAFARRYNGDSKLRGVIVEDKASGISALQTLNASAEDWLRGLLVAFPPSGDKETRANQAAVWCKNGSILLPLANEAAEWLVDFEDELFTFPSGAFKDQVDSFSQLAIYLEHLLSDGYRQRSRDSSDSSLRSE